MAEKNEYASVSQKMLTKMAKGFKVMDKMFAYVALAPKDGIFRADLKCDAERSLELRERYEGITATDFKTPLWNTVYLDSDVPDTLIEELIRHSADEVIRKLPKKRREEYLSEQ